MESLIYVVLVASLVALGFAFVFYRQMLKESEGTDLMKKIAEHVRKGAMAYSFRSVVAFLMSSAPKMADTTATPETELPLISQTLS